MALLLSHHSIRGTALIFTCSPHLAHGVTQCKDDSPTREHLGGSLTETGLNQLWETPSSHVCLKKLVNKTIKLLSVLKDKDALAGRAHGRFVFNNYKIVGPQPWHTPTLPPWKRNPALSSCRLCDDGKEVLPHLICTCKALMDERRLLLKHCSIKEEYGHVGKQYWFACT